MTAKLRLVGTGLAFVLAFSSPVLAGEGSATANMVSIEGGPFSPFFNKDKNGDPTELIVDSFTIDIAPVTNADFLRFTKSQPQWSRQNIKGIFAEPSYLKHWETSDNNNSQPVRYVSWFAASAYCESLGKQLPSILQWEYVGAADENNKMAAGSESYRQKILQWYSRPSANEFPDVMSSERNAWGVYDLHGLIWEWNLDFNTALVTGESREDAILNRDRFCGSGALGANDKLDYGAFMRFGFRSSLKGNYTIGNLGFRCVKNNSI